MYNNARKPFRHVEETLVFKAHNMACAWMWPEDDDVASRTDAQKHQAKILRSLLVEGLRRIEDSGRNPMLATLVSDVLPDANVMGLIWKKLRPDVPDKAISECVGNLVIEQIYGPRDRFLWHLVDAHDCANAYAYGQALEARMREEVAQGLNPLSKTAKQLGLVLADMRPEAAARLGREERERLEADTDAFAAGGLPAQAQVKAGLSALRDDGAIPSHIQNNYGDMADAALL
jgi:hypothetical protein